ncbi:MAG: EAL domain-containing protein [Oxalobacteraceae bacterium]|nr:MAG: EAL domain-containing protein [Oxalobacteraceae bacterium]
MMNLVLIVSNVISDVTVLREALQKAHDGPYQVVWLRSLSEALDRLPQDDVDVILIDLVLQDSQGIETFDQIYAAAPHIPILTLSTLEDETLGVEAVQRGAQGYLSKGYFSSYLVPQSLRNVIQRKAVEQNLFTEKERATITLDSISDAVICTDLHGAVDYLNKAGEQMTGWNKEEARGRPISEVMPLIDQKTRQPVRNPVELALERGQVVDLPPETMMLRRGGEEAAIADSTAPIRNRRGDIAGAVIVFRDITATLTMSQKMAHLAQHDVLTNLPNRLLLNDRMTQAIVQAKRHGTSGAVLFMDLDKFKSVNDSLGHDIGDKLLQSVAQRLCACVRASDTVSRIGGDEFVILLAATQHTDDAVVTADKIVTALAAPHIIGRHELFMTSSMGISLFPSDGNTPDLLLKHADTAMYEAKQGGRNSYRFFTSSMNVQAVERLLFESVLRKAIGRSELLLHFQPKVNLGTGRIIGVEALVRWMHPDWGMTRPLRFIHIAENCGMIVPIGQWVLREACAHAMRWKAEGLDPGTIAVNVSSLEFRHKDFVQGVRGALQASGLAPQNLQIEITESILMRDVSASIAVLTQLKALGVELAVDDFGTGHSSLSDLMQFPIDVLKIDQSFVRNADTTASNGIIVGAVIGMGKNLSHRVIAEGVEDQGQLDFLRKHHCEEGQGYFFSHPVDSDAFAQLLRTGLET